MAKVDKNLRRVSAEGYFFGSRMSRKTLSTAKNTAGEEVSIAFTLLNNTNVINIFTSSITTGVIARNDGDEVCAYRQGRQ